MKIEFPKLKKSLIKRIILIRYQIFKKVLIDQINKLKEFNKNKKINNLKKIYLLKII